MAAQIDSDLDLAFHLQLQEALAASLALQPSSSSSPPPIHRHSDAIATENDPVTNLAVLRTGELSKFEQELNDRIHSEAIMRKAREDLSRRIHDQKVAREIEMIPDDDWTEWGEDFEKPFGEGCSKSGEIEDMFRLYFKGLTSEESVGGVKTVLAGIGVAICDCRDNLILEVSKPLVGSIMNKRFVECKALIEGLNAAFSLELKRIEFFCDYHLLYQFITGRWPLKQQKMATLVNQVSILQRKFTYCNPSHVARKDIKFAFKLARDAIDSQITKPARSRIENNMKETCVICLEDTDKCQIFSVDGCLHWYCISCMKQHVEVKLLNGMVPKCPHEGCKSELNVESCGKFLTPKLIGKMQLRIKEASIPATEKVYCPFPLCSALMSKQELYSFTVKECFMPDKERKCMKCLRFFCIYCKVPWHTNMACSEYKRLNLHPSAEDVKLKSLAKSNLWRQCGKCNHMIELAEGCYHMTCRCGSEFCYRCGAEWKDKKATCSCPLWEEENIWHDDFEEEDDFEEVDDEEYDSDSDWW